MYLLLRLRRKDKPGYCSTARLQHYKGGATLNLVARVAFLGPDFRRDDVTRAGVAANFCCALRSWAPTFVG